MAKTGSPLEKSGERLSESDRRAEERRLARLRRHLERRHDLSGESAFKGRDRRRIRDRRAEDLDRRLAYNRRRTHGRRGGYDREAGLKRLGINKATSKALRDFQPVLSKHMDAILDDYEALVPASFRGPGANRSRAQLKRRWLEDVFGGRFQGTDMRKRTNAHRAGKGTELESAWFIPSYNFILGRVMNLVTATYAKQPKKMKTIQEAVTQAVFLEMDLAVFNHTRTMEELSPWADMLSPEEVAFLMDGSR